MKLSNKNIEFLKDKKMRDIVDAKVTGLQNSIYQDICGATFGCQFCRNNFNCSFCQSNIERSIKKVNEEFIYSNNYTQKVHLYANKFFRSFNSLSQEKFSNTKFISKTIVNHAAKLYDLFDESVENDCICFNHLGFYLIGVLHYYKQIFNRIHASKIALINN